MRLIGKNKLGLLLLFLLCAFMFTNDTGTDLSALNSKYGLISAEPLNPSDSDSIAFSENFSPDNLKANVFDILGPKIELLVKLEGAADSTFLDDVFLLKLRTNADPLEIAEQYESIDIISFAEPNFDVQLNDSDFVEKLGDVHQASPRT